MMKYFIILFLTYSDYTIYNIVIQSCHQHVVSGEASAGNNGKLGLINKDKDGDINTLLLNTVEL